MNNWFTYDGKKYFIGTIIKLKEQYKKKYDFNTCLEYKKVDYEKMHIILDRCIGHLKIII